MGWTPVNNVSIERNYKPREIVIRWHCAVLGSMEKKFGFDEEDEAIAFAAKEFKQMCM